MGQDTYRYRPRENDAINKSWMCDHGRLSYKEINRDRALQPLVGRGAEARDASKQEAAKVAAARLSALAGTEALAVVVSPVCTNENLLAAQSRIRDVDYASETAKLTQTNILAAAGAAVLTQANQTPQLVLQLLHGV